MCGEVLIVNSQAWPGQEVEVRLADYLEAHIPGFCAPVAMRKFPGGQSNPTFLIEAASGNYVLRAKPVGSLLASAHAIDREFRVLQALDGSAVPVARPLHLCEDEKIFGAMFYLMEFVQGRIFWDPALPELEKGLRRRVIEEQVRVLAALHSVDVAAVGLSDYGATGNYLYRQISRWSKQYRSTETESIPTMEALLQWLPANLPLGEPGISLIHGDYRLDNLLYHPGEPRVLAVLDWELSTLGDPLADLAYLCMCMRLPEVATLKGIGGQDAQELGVPTEQEMIALYCGLRGLDGIGNWPFYLAFSYFRLAAICQGVYKRALEGNASDSSALSRGNQAGVLSGMAVELLQEEGLL
jgi:aminoglycoside phosphotransferase (APT) family kinase protein